MVLTQTPCSNPVSQYPHKKLPNKACNKTLSQNYNYTSGTKLTNKSQPSPTLHKFHILSTTAGRFNTACLVHPRLGTIIYHTDTSEQQRESSGARRAGPTLGMYFPLVSHFAPLLYPARAEGIIRERAFHFCAPRVFSLSLSLARALFRIWFTARDCAWIFHAESFYALCIYIDARRGDNPYISVHILSPDMDGRRFFVLSRCWCWLFYDIDCFRILVWAMVSLPLSQGFSSAKRDSWCCWWSEDDGRRIHSC